MANKREWTVKVIKLTLSLLIGAAFANLAQAEVLDNVDFYLGTEYEWTNLRVKQNGRHILGKSYPGANFFLGVRWLNLALEGGYNLSMERRKSHKFDSISFGRLSELVGNTNAISFLAQGGSLFQSLKLSTHSQLDGWHLDLNGYIPLCDCWEMLGSCGYGWMKLHMGQKITLSGNGPVTLPAGTGSIQLPGFLTRSNGDIYAKFSTKSNYHGVFRVGGGFQYVLSDCIGFRGLVRWKNLKRLKAVVSQGGDVNLTSYTTKLKDALCVNIGAYLFFY